MNGIWVGALPCPMHLGFSNYENPIRIAGHLNEARTTYVHSRPCLNLREEKKGDEWALFWEVGEVLENIDQGLDSFNTQNHIIVKVTS